MHHSFDVDKIVSFLSRYKDDLPQLYKWRPEVFKLFDLGVLSDGDLSDLQVVETAYEREVKIKEAVGELLREYDELQDMEEFEKLALWVVRDWGGIKRARISTLMPLLDEFILYDGKPSFDRVASVSKIAAYMFPERHLIYDSRVAYTLNWIILSEDAGEKFFPMPAGRNSKMTAMDISVLIRLKHMEHYTPKDVTELDDRLYINKKDKSLFIPKEEAYTTLNSLIRQVNQRLWNGEQAKYLYNTEMLLFALADREVFYDISRKYKKL